MKRSNRLMLVVGVVLAVAAFGGVLMFGQSPSSEPVEPETVAVVTAAADLTLGTAITADLVTTVDIPVADALETYRQTADVLGRVVRRQINAGEVLSPADFSPTTSEQTAQIVVSLAAGQRAIAVQLDRLAGVGAIIQAGDSVDVILAMTDSDGKFPIVNGTSLQNADGPQSLDELANNTSVKVLVQNVQVLAVTPTAAANGTAVVDPATGQPMLDQILMILSVTPQEAELIRFTQLDGNLSVILRSPADRDAADEETTGTTLRTLVDEHGVLPPRAIVSELP